MTIAATRTYEFDVGGIIRQAYRDAGLLSEVQNCSQAQVTEGKDKLQRITTSAAVYGFLARVTDFYELPIVATIFEYSLPTYVADVWESAMFIAPGQDTTRASAEIMVEPRQREEWQTMGSKSATGSPSFYFPNRAAVPIQVKIWPIPGTNEDGGTIRFQVHKYRADTQLSTVTPDFEKYWVDYLVFELAARLALSNSLSMERFTALEGKAQVALRDAKSYSRQRGPQRFVYGHVSPWRGR